DLLEAASRYPSEKVRGLVQRYESSRKKDDPLSPYQELLEGGNPDSGRTIFFERPDVSCLRCHRVGDEGGTVGPLLTKIGSARTREKLLESILFPNKEISPGYGQELLAMKDGAVEAGRIERESSTELVLVLSDGQHKRVPKADIRSRKAGLSAMPEDVAKPLSKRELRDLVAFLAGLR